MALKNTCRAFGGALSERGGNSVDQFVGQNKRLVSILINVPAVSCGIGAISNPLSDGLAIQMTRLSRSAAGRRRRPLTCDGRLGRPKMPKNSQGDPSQDTVTLGIFGVSWASWERPDPAAIKVCLGWFDAKRLSGGAQ
jgi:hypothetical protein